MAPCRLVGTGARRSRTTFNFHEESITHPPSLFLVCSCGCENSKRIEFCISASWDERKRALYLSSHASETHQNMTFDYYSELSWRDVAKSTSRGGSPFGRSDETRQNRDESQSGSYTLAFLTSPFFTLLRALSDAAAKCAKTSVGHRGKHEFRRT